MAQKLSQAWCRNRLEDGISTGNNGEKQGPDHASPAKAGKLGIVKRNKESA